MATHETAVRNFPYFSSGIVWEATCSCGYYTGKCLNEAEVKYRLKRHLEDTSPST